MNVGKCRSVGMALLQNKRRRAEELRMDTGSQLRGLQRVLSREVHVSDLLQHLSDLDPSPWESLLGWTPRATDRERKLATLRSERRVKGTVDLLLSDGDEEVAIEVKVGHRFSADQQERYEKSSKGRLVLAGLAADESLVVSVPRWEFLKLDDAFEAWASSSNQEAAVLGRAAAVVLREWDSSIAAVFGEGKESRPLNSIKQKFLAIVIARRIADELAQRVWHVQAGVTSGGGLALVQAWDSVGKDPDRCVIAEVRWQGDLRAGELRLGVDYSLAESRAARADAWALAKAMDESIRIDALRKHLAELHPHLDKLLLRSDAGRRPTNDDTWQQVVERGFKSKDNPQGVEGGRSQNNPGFVGDGTQRFEAVSKIDYSSATASNLIELIEVSLEYLKSRLPAE